MNAIIYVIIIRSYRYLRLILESIIIITVITGNTLNKNKVLNMIFLF